LLSATSWRRRSCACESFQRGSPRWLVAGAGKIARSCRSIASSDVARESFLTTASRADFKQVFEEALGFVKGRTNNELGAILKCFLPIHIRVDCSTSNVLNKDLFSLAVTPVHRLLLFLGRHGESSCGTVEEKGAAATTEQGQQKFVGGALKRCVLNSAAGLMKS